MAELVADGQVELERVSFLEIYTENQLHEKYGHIKQETNWKTNAKKYVRAKLTCSGTLIKNFVFGILPILRWLPKYNPKTYLLGDIAAGLTVGIVHLPQGMAYSILATMPAVTGLYVSFFPVLAYIFFGTSRHISIGTFAVISLMVGEVLSKHVTPCPVESSAFSTATFPASHTESIPIVTSGVPYSAQSVHELCESANLKRKTGIAIALAMTNGIIMVAMYIFRLGIVTVYFSDHLVSSFTCGASFHVLTSQVPKLFGITIARKTGPLELIYKYIEIFKNISTINWATFIISLCCILPLVLGKEINARLRDRLPIPLPWELAIVIFSTIASYYGYISTNYGVAVVGPVPTGFQVSVPTGSDIALVFEDAIPIAIVTYAIEISLCNMFALKHSYEINSNQELLALAAGNILGSFFSCFPSAASLSRTVIWDEVGAHTQITGIFSSALILIVLLWIGPLFQSLPQAALAAIIVVNLKGMLRQFEKVIPLWKVSKLDALAWVVTWTAVILLGVATGLFIGVGFGLLTVIFRTQITKGRVFGDVGGTGNYRDPAEYRIPNSSERIIIVNFPGPVHFANRARFKSQIIKILGFDPALEASMVKKINVESEEIVGTNRQTIRNYSATENSNLEHHDRGPSNSDPNSPGANSDTVLTPNSPTSNGLHLRNASTMNGSRHDNPSTSIVRNIEHIILDMSSCTFLDNDGAKIMKSLYLDLRTLGTRLSMASCNACVREAIIQVCQDEIPAFFVSLDRAMEFARGEAGIQLNQQGNVEAGDTQLEEDRL